MTSTRVAYSLDTGGRRPGISIRLDVGAPLAPAALLKLFHEAAAAWERANPRALLRSELDGPPVPCADEASAFDYLYAGDSFNRKRLHRHLTMLAEHASIHRFVPKPGAPVEGRDLWGRDGEKSRLLRCVRSGSCHLQGPRRYGKTSLLRWLEQRLAGENRPAVLADVSACDDAAGFLATLAAEAMDVPLLHAPLGEAVPELRRWPNAGPATDADRRSSARRRLLASIHGDPERFGERLLGAMAAVGVVVLIDEFSLFLRAILSRSQDETRRLLALLRGARRRTPPLRQTVAGSAGLAAFARFHDLGDFLGDLAAVPVKPLEAAQGEALAEELIYGAGLRPSPGMAAEVLEAIGLPVPYFIHALCDAARMQAGAASIVDEATVRAAYSERVLGPVGNHLFRVYRLDYQPYPETLRGAAAHILTELARSPRGSSHAALAAMCRRAWPDAVAQLPSLLACLSEDYDLEEDGRRLRFRSKALRERWLLFGQTSA